jgi:hypothetical protein
MKLFASFISIVYGASVFRIPTPPESSDPVDIIREVWKRDKQRDALEIFKLVQLWVSIDETLFFEKFAEIVKTEGNETDRLSQFMETVMISRPDISLRDLHSEVRTAFDIDIETVQKWRWSNWGRFHPDMPTSQQQESVIDSILRKFPKTNRENLFGKILVELDKKDLPLISREGLDTRIQKRSAQMGYLGRYLESHPGSTFPGVYSAYLREYGEEIVLNLADVKNWARRNRGVQNRTTVSASLYEEVEDELEDTEDVLAELPGLLNDDETETIRQICLTKRKMKPQQLLEYLSRQYRGLNMKKLMIYLEKIPECLSRLHKEFLPKVTKHLTEFIEAYPTSSIREVYTSLIDNFDVCEIPTRSRVRSWRNYHKRMSHK